jgi:hypothetical protein
MSPQSAVGSVFRFFFWFARAEFGCSLPGQFATQFFEVFCSSIFPRACKSFYRLKWSPYNAYYLENFRIIL